MHSSTVLPEKNSILPSHKRDKSQTLSSYPYTSAIHANWFQESGAGTVNSTRCHLQRGTTAVNIIFCSMSPSSPSAPAASALFFGQWGRPLLAFRATTASQKPQSPFGQGTLWHASPQTLEPLPPGPQERNDDHEDYILSATEHVELSDGPHKVGALPFSQFSRQCQPPECPHRIWIETERKPAIIAAFIATICSRIIILATSPTKQHTPPDYLRHCQTKFKFALLLGYLAE